MRYWIVKSEPGEYSWDDLVKEKVCPWVGIRNYQARNFLSEMKKGDKAFFYHSGAEKAIVGISEVVKTAYADATATESGTWLCVDLKALTKSPNSVSLAVLKSKPLFNNLLLIRNSRISVSPVAENEAAEILRMGGWN